MANAPRLRSLPFLARVGLTCLLFVLLGGLLTSGLQIAQHHQNRDERPGLSMDDLVGAYHGINTVAPLRRALEDNHPEELPADQRQALLDWLASDRISDDYDSLDLGMNAPAEIIAQNCLQCHARQATEGDGIGKTTPLEYWDDVANLAFSREINPTSVEILIASTHTHALGIGLVTLMAMLLLIMTAWPRVVVQTLIFLAGVGLMADIGGQWLARLHESFVYAIVIGGAAFGAATGLMIVAVIIDLWLPGRKA
jgi:hypothetical protein